MSNVTAEEVVSIVCKVFDVGREQLASGKRTPGQPVRPWPFFARQCAIYLMQRHAGLSQRRILDSMGTKDSAGARAFIVKTCEHLADQRSCHGPLAELMERCEVAIDKMHDHRTDWRTNGVDLELGDVLEAA